MDLRLPHTHDPRPAGPSSTDASGSYRAPAEPSRDLYSVTREQRTADPAGAGAGRSTPRTRASRPTRATVTWARNGRDSGAYQPPATSALDSTDWIRAMAPPGSDSATASTRGRRAGSHSASPNAESAAGSPATTPHAAAIDRSHAPGVSPGSTASRADPRDARDAAPGTSPTISDRHRANASRAADGQLEGDEQPGGRLASGGSPGAPRRSRPLGPGGGLGQRGLRLHEQPADQVHRHRGRAVADVGPAPRQQRPPRDPRRRLSGTPRSRRCRPACPRCRRRDRRSR